MLASVPSDVVAELVAGFRLWKEGAPAAAQARIEGALERATDLGSTLGQLSALHLLGNLAFDQGDLAACRALHAAVLAECRALRIGVGVASSLHNLGLLAAREGDGAAARRLIAEAINLYRQMGRHEAAERARDSLRRLAESDSRAIEP
jgi:hypothetical protein